jgi:hypothetical protein
MTVHSRNQWNQTKIGFQLLETILGKGRDDEFHSLVILNTTSAKKIMDRDSSMKSIAEIYGNTYKPDDIFKSPFVDWDMPQIYTFVKSHLRSLEEATEEANGWTHYTFVVLDSITTKDGTILLCYDGPDYGEGHEDPDEIILKAARVSLNDLVSLLQTLETLVGILSDHVGNYERVLSQQPPASLESFPGAEPGVYKIAPPVRARRNKRVAIMQAEENGIGDETRIAFAKSLRVAGAS